MKIKETSILVNITRAWVVIENNHGFSEVTHSNQVSKDCPSNIGCQGKQHKIIVLENNKAVQRMAIFPAVVFLEHLVFLST